MFAPFFLFFLISCIHCDPEFDEADFDPNFITIFNNECAYIESNIAPKDACDEVNLNSNSQIEILLPVSKAGSNATFFIPFLVSQKQKRTSISKKAMDVLKVKEGDDITIDRKSVV